MVMLAGQCRIGLADTVAALPAKPECTIYSVCRALYFAQALQISCVIFFRAACLPCFAEK